MSSAVVVGTSRGGLICDIDVPGSFEVETRETGAFLKKLRISIPEPRVRAIFPSLDLK